MEELTDYKVKVIETRLDKLEQKNDEQHTKIQDALTEIRVELGKQRVTVGGIAGFISLTISSLMGWFFVKNGR